MRTPYQINKWDIFRELEKLPRDSKKRSELLAKFNNMIQDHITASVYYQRKTEEDTCENCGHDEFKKIIAEDEYYQFCKNCSEEL